MIYFGTVLGGKHEQQEERSEPMELVYMDGKKEPYTLSSIVADCAEIKHRHLKILLNKHREDFESFGKVQFKISPSKSGQNVRDYILNEQQATLMITYLRNTVIYQLLSICRFKREFKQDVYLLRTKVNCKDVFTKICS